MNRSIEQQVGHVAQTIKKAGCGPAVMCSGKGAQWRGRQWAALDPRVRGLLGTACQSAVWGGAGSHACLAVDLLASSSPLTGLDELAVDVGIDGLQLLQVDAKGVGDDVAIVAWAGAQRKQLCHRRKQTAHIVWRPGHCFSICLPPG